ncbi:phosphodiesterase [Pleomorphomonas diazotrophica]|uniref:Phosphodiesterase n=1 Tax=Pleomorphomonas diazotrophica TaxID=1166257 RepID=A0A1I4S3U6_9HYPH|nr:phosphodiesterase [Pleomorphomonas diazotrophica]PKR89976.1 phosphodiesterase [Pleomorphomonas diazotrophica]SFM59157.1 3',5'-cyclic AMP phosphodiesterase CpdA [Pleomorphomonas diazotrophica]
MKLIQVTDIHLRERGEPVCGLDPAANLAATIADINRHHADADLVVFTGDLSDDGSPASYRLFADLLESLIPPHRLLLGNHDDRTAFRAMFPDAPAEDDFIQSVLDTDAGRLVFLDTLDEGAVGGLLCDRRLTWLDRRLSEASGPAIVFMHHPPFDIGMPPLDGVKLANPSTLGAVFRRHGNVRHIFAGHVHRLCSGIWNGTAFNTGRGTSHQTAPLFGAKTFAVGFEMPAYNVILTDGASMVVHAQEVG